MPGNPFLKSSASLNAVLLAVPMSDPGSDVVPYEHRCFGDHQRPPWPTTLWTTTWPAGNECQNGVLESAGPDKDGEPLGHWEGVPKAGSAGCHLFQDPFVQAYRIVSAYPLTSTYLIQSMMKGIKVCWGSAESSEGLARLVRDGRRWGNEWMEDGNVEEHQPQTEPLQSWSRTMIEDHEH